MKTVKSVQCQNTEGVGQPCYNLPPAANPIEYRHIKSVHGYVCTAAAGWDDDDNLEKAINLQSRLEMRLLIHTDRHDQRFYRGCLQAEAEWIASMLYAPISLHAIDSSVEMPREDSVRNAVTELVKRTVANHWFVASFNVCEENGLNILLGYAHDSANFEEPCRLYAKVNVCCPAKEVHLRFRPNYHKLRLNGGALFTDVHMTDLPGSTGHGNYEAIRVREHFLPASGEFGRFDACDLMFTEHHQGDVPTVRYNSVKPMSVVDFTS